jgi:antitoxin component YwqK of YwqJK toxin-antitoxin module
MIKFLIVLFYFFFSLNLNGQITINQIDSLGNKEGIWREFKILPYTIIKENTLYRYPSDSSLTILIDELDFNEKSILVEAIGRYQNGLKNSEWIEFYSNKKKKSVVEYVEGVPKGKCKLYYTNEKLKMSCIIGNEKKVQISIYDEGGCLINKPFVEKNDIIRSIYQN